MKPRPKFCEGCGRELPLVGKFCPGCGDLIEETTTPSVEVIPPPSIPKPPITPPTTANQPISQTTTKPPFGTSPGYTPPSPGGVPVPTPPPFRGGAPYAGGKIAREKRMGGGIPTLLGGLAFLGYPVYTIIVNKVIPSFNDLTTSIAVVIPVGIVALVVGVFMLKVRSWKSVILAFLCSMILAAYSGYSMYQLLQVTQSTAENIPNLLQSGLVFIIAGCVLALFGFSRAFKSLTRR